MIIDTLNKYVESIEENKHPKFEFRFSAAGECQRKLDYEYQFGPKPIDAKSFFRMQLGHAAHNLMRDVITGALGDDFCDAEKEIKYEFITGHPDGRIKSLKATLEIKSVSDSTFMMIKQQNAPLDAHIWQGNAYAVVEGDENVLCLYINRNNGEMEEFIFPTDQQLFIQTKLKFTGVKANKDLGKISDRPFSDPAESPCWFCPWKEKCYEGWSEEVLTNKNVIIADNDSLYLDALNAVKARVTRLSSETLETTLRKAVGEKLKADYQAQFATLKGPSGDLKVSIALSKDKSILATIKEVKNGKSS